MTRQEDHPLLAIALAVVGFLALAAAAATECDTVWFTRAYSEGGNSWCEGYWPLPCTYCWDTATGANCASNWGSCRLQNPDGG